MAAVRPRLTDDGADMMTIDDVVADGAVADIRVMAGMVVRDVAMVDGEVVALVGTNEEQPQSNVALIARTNQAFKIVFISPIPKVVDKHDYYGHVE